MYLLQIFRLSSRRRCRGLLNFCRLLLGSLFLWLCVFSFLLQALRLACSAVFCRAADFWGHCVPHFFLGGMTLLGQVSKKKRFFSFLLCVFLCFCLLSVSAFCCFADDWVERTVSIDGLNWGWYGRTSDGSYVDLTSSDSKLASKQPPENLNRLTLSYYPSDTAQPFGFSGDLRIRSFFYNFDVSRSFGIVYFTDGTQADFDFSASVPGEGFVNFSFSGVFSRPVKELAFYFPLSVASGGSLGPFTLPSGRTVVLGSGSSASPTFPSFDNSGNSQAAGAVDDYAKAESGLMDGVASGLSQADDLINDLPGKFEQYVDGFSFWRNLFNEGFHVPWLSFLAMVSLAVGVYCIVLKILPKQGG